MRTSTICAAMLILAPHWCTAQTASRDEARALNMPDPAGPPFSEPEFIPMTEAERFRFFVKTTFSAQALLTTAAGSGITQLEHTPKEWQLGAEGYGMRVGNAYAQQIIRSTLIFGASSVLHEDNRYLRSGKSGFGPRLKYAIASTFLARRDDGTRTFSFSRVGGTAGTAVISRIWQPRSTNTMGDASTSFGISMASQAGFNVVREFLPELLPRHRSGGVGSKP